MITEDHHHGGGQHRNETSSDREGMGSAKLMRNEQRTSSQEAEEV